MDSRSIIIFCFFFYFIFCVEDFKVQTDTSVVFFGVDHPQVTFHAYDKETNTTSKNAFVIQYNYLAERDYITDEIVQIVHLPAIEFTFNFTDTPDISSGLNYTDAVQITYTSILTGSKLISWVFIEDQIITDLLTGTQTQVPQGSSKFSFEAAFWPFINDKNYLELSGNATTLDPDSIEGCASPETPPTESLLICKTEEIIGTLQLLREEVVIDLFTLIPEVQSVDIELFVCPSPYGDTLVTSHFLGGQPSNLCNISLTTLGSFPRNFYSDFLEPKSSSEYYNTISLESDSDPCDDEDPVYREKRIIPAISQIEIKIRYSNFINSSILYDPELSVLFSGSSNNRQGGNSNSNKNCKTSYDVTKDWILWASIGSAVLMIMICLLFLMFASTKIGIRILHGKEQSRISTIRTLSKSVSNPKKMKDYFDNIDDNQWPNVAPKL